MSAKPALGSIDNTRLVLTISKIETRKYNMANKSKRIRGIHNELDDDDNDYYCSVLHIF